MITEYSNFPICFLAQKTGNYYSYAANGLGIILHPKDGHIIKSNYMNEFNTKEMFFKYLNEILKETRNGTKTHQEITQNRFEEIAGKTFLNIFQPDLKNTFCDNLKEVIIAHNYKMGWDLNP